jgi:hypothetical protein
MTESNILPFALIARAKSTTTIIFISVVWVAEKWNAWLVRLASNYLKVTVLKILTDSFQVIALCVHDAGHNLNCAARGLATKKSTY